MPSGTLQPRALEYFRDGFAAARAHADVHELLLNGPAGQSSTTAVGGGSAGSDR